MGYQVWSDVTKLFGGEKWWEDIEQAVDQFSCKFIIVITKTSLSKPGVQRELELAFQAEKKYKIENFIIPVIIDDSSFGGQPYGLSQRNIISFFTGWGQALAKLKERLARDNVPIGPVGKELGYKLMDLSSANLQLQKLNDLVVSNWLDLDSHPNYLNFYRIPGDYKLWRKNFDDLPYPWFEWGGMLVSFAEINVIQQYLPKHVTVNTAPRLQLSAVLNKVPRNHTKFLHGEVIKKMNYMISEAWNLKLCAIGLHRYEMASGRLAWFFPKNDEFSGFHRFADVFGEERRKQVIGYSAKNNVYWHYAIDVKAQYGLHAKVILIPHVVFTEDGKNPLLDKKKMHRLRRGFCASWWNDRWRDLLFVYLNIIAQGEKSIDVALGQYDFLSFSSRPRLLKSEYSLMALSEEQIIESEDEFDVHVEVERDEI